MKKFQLDPKNMEVVKKTVTVAKPGPGAKTKGGVPLDPKARAKFYDDEISRFSDLIVEYADKAGQNAPNAKLSAMYRKKNEEAKKMQNFLQEQRNAFQGQLEAEAQKKKDIASGQAYAKKQAERPILQKVKDAMQTIGSSGYMTR
jgi:hypothetical protein